MKKIIEKIAEEVKDKFEGESSGHDWWHIYRVWVTAQKICEKEKANMDVVSLGALLHDIADWKFHDNDDSVGPSEARRILEREKVDEDIILQVCKIIEEVSYKGANVDTRPSSIEGMIVQDADRLDAMGAIGIARTFAFGGHQGRSMYNPDIEPTMHQSKEEYMDNDSSTVNHFYEKLLLLKERMNTDAGKEMAEKRHKIMEDFLEYFKKEWEGLS